MGKQLATKQIEIDGTDTPLSRACDLLMQERAALESLKETVAEAEARVVDEMLKAKQSAVLHKGRKISIVPRPEKIVVRIN